MDPDTTNCILLGIHVDKKKFLAMTSIDKLVYVQGMAVKKGKRQWRIKGCATWTTESLIQKALKTS